MYLKYGSYIHAVDEAAVVMSKQRKLNELGAIVGGTETWSISGMLHGDSVSDLTTKIQALDAAYSVVGADIYLLDDNQNPTAHYIRSSDTISGVIATSIRFPFSNGAEYTTFRSYEIQIEARYDADVSGGGGGGKQGPLNNDVVEFQQVISFTGTGGSQFVVRTPRYGPPIYQTVSRQTPISVQQTGSAVGWRGYPAPPPPLYPNLEHVDRRQISRQFPQMNGNRAREFRINWTYSFTLV